MITTFKRMKEPKNIAAAAITAALYVSLTSPVGFEMIQFRFSEVLCLLAFIDPIYGVGVTIGCFFANIASPFGILDIIVGSLATFASVACISKSRNLFVASLWPTVFSLPVAGMITFMSGAESSFIVTAAWLALSEFFVVSIIGYPLFTALLRNPHISMILKSKDSKATLQ